ncbi:hypothetical protein HOLleu_01462 [Holothuria leucospilota]|uniref:Uncharacterized protein n=1 Tax=Holothuria leucospilota TaxID=206669 RepID=A0A9Q1HK98_HOLLE|nr:hypothetical protein HOLleu_01462 [Holothuria leucospilota]
MDREAKMQKRVYKDLFMNMHARYMTVTGGSLFGLISLTLWKCVPGGLNKWNKTI